MEMNEKDLGKVAGGTAVETKDGQWILIPHNVKIFASKEDAEKAEKEFMEKCPPHCHGPFHGGKHGGKHGGFMPPMDPPPNEGPEHE